MTDLGSKAIFQRFRIKTIQELPSWRPSCVPTQTPRYLNLYQEPAPRWRRDFWRPWEPTEPGWPNAQEMQQISGIAPVTQQSGKSKVVHRRWACNRFLLQTFHEFAAHSIKHSIWAKAYYNMMIKDRGHKHQSAVRALAFKWIRVIFCCWKKRTNYDELVYTTSLIKRKSQILKFFASDAS